MMAASRLRAFGAFLAVFLIGCTAILRYPRGPLPSDFDESLVLATGMNRDFLTRDAFDELVIEIDWVEGAWTECGGASHARASPR